MSINRAQITALLENHNNLMTITKKSKRAMNAQQKKLTESLDALTESLTRLVQYMALMNAGAPVDIEKLRDHFNAYENAGNHLQGAMAVIKDEAASTLQQWEICRQTISDVIGDLPAAAAP